MQKITGQRFWEIISDTAGLVVTATLLYVTLQIIQEWLE